ncbi:hypothetical protein [Asanoa sp. NPDC050611]|uniref:hypothetical protein n=1 Tax=Asanoa sp. NPDC050611 TaxID=3157098 RepID=UPI003406E53D
MGVRRLAVALAVVLVAVLTMAGCAGGSARGSYLVQTGYSCPAVDRLGVPASADPLPADFRPVSAVRCGFQLTMGQPSGIVWATAERSTGPFDDLVHALRLPPLESPGDAVCPAIHLMPSVLALTDAAGTTVLPALPGTVCNHPHPDVVAAIGALEWVAIDRR